MFFLGIGGVGCRPILDNTDHTTNSPDPEKINQACARTQCKHNRVNQHKQHIQSAVGHGQEEIRSNKKQINARTKVRERVEAEAKVQNEAVKQR